MGVDAIEHTASPVTFDVEDPKGTYKRLLTIKETAFDLIFFIEIIDPAVKGTLGILKSALRSCVFLLSNA
jgi:hypothetical protein